MVQINYDKLNDYLNDLFIKLEKQDAFAISNLYWNIGLFEKYNYLYEKHLEESPKIEDNSYLDNYYKNYLKINQKELSFEDIYLITRKIIESINKEYLIYYDQIIKNGVLDFSYDNDYRDSQFIYKVSNNIKLININRHFDYTDISTLVHEFMHYMSSIEGKKRTVSLYNLTEFISIYFQEYAKKYLIEQGITKEQVKIFSRINSTYKRAKRSKFYNYILLCYQKFGNIGEDTYQMLREIDDEVEKEQFNEYCNVVINQLENFEKEAKKVMMENEIKNYIINKIVEIIHNDFVYSIGTIFSYYALENSTNDQMIWLCNNVNKTDNILYLLNKIGIDLENISVKQLMGPTKKQMKKIKEKR